MALVAKVGLAEQIRAILAERISQGVLAPKQRLVELVLAKEFGTSQSPVREALRLLVSQGYAETQPNKGTWVRALTNRDQYEANTTRAYLEEGVVRDQAARLKDVPGFVDGLMRLVDEQMAAVQAHDLPRAAALNTQFHRAIVEASGNRTLVTMWESLALQAHSQRTITMQSVDLIAATEEHRAIVVALGEGDGPRAAQLLREHTQTFAKNDEKISNSE